MSEKHLEMIQDVIARMARNSFQLKGWSVLLASALLALAARDANHWLVAIALLPVLMFWGLDGYFLAQERAFRRLYNRVIDPDDDSVRPFAITPEPTPASAVLRTALSPTLAAFHGTLTGLLLIIIALLAW